MLNIGQISDQKVLAQYYSMADVTVATSKKETFHMPTAESLACGTPVVGFRAEGPETICLNEYGEFVEYGDVGTLTACILKWINFKNEHGAEISNAAYEYYSKERMCKRFLEVYEAMMDK